MAGAITDIANVAISLQGTTVSRQGYGTPVFLSKHAFSENTVESFANLLQVGQMFPTTHNVYKAATSFFSNSPVAKAFKVGKIDNSLLLTPAAVATGKVYSFTIKSGALSANITVTAIVSDTVTTIGAAIAAAVEASVVAAKVVAVSAVGVVTITPTLPTDKFSVAALNNLTDTYTSTATAAASLVKVLDADSDCYFITSEDHLEAWVLAMAADVEAREKLYGVSVAGLTNYGTYTKGASIAGDILGKLSDQGYMRTFTLYHQSADTNFPELNYIGHNAPFDAGSVIWTNNVVSLSASQNVDGNILTSTQQNNLSARNATFIRNEGGNNATRGGLVVGGERIDNIRGRDALQDEMKANLTALLLNQKGGKLPYNNDGINQVRSVINKSLDEFVRRNFINDNYLVSLPDERDVQVSKKAIGLFDQGTFKAELTGAIELIDILGTLSVSFNA
jgi:hypothetical protein